MALEKKKSETPEGVTPGEAGLSTWFREFIDLREGMDRTGAVESITGGNLMRGSNAWMLVCSIMIASLGLNLNSGAVIIGAMLISPLMNPILGLGLGVGTNDREMLWVALKNFGVAILIALLTSSFYFLFTPLDIFTSEMRARTEPTILDGLIAVFGGLAGIISVTRANKTNAIPGVAIATALMPPLCVAGYGITVGLKTGGDFTIFWRSFYLFFLNSFFIAATAYLIIRLLGFPLRTYMNKRESQRSQLIIGLVSVLMVFPGYFILRDVIDRQRDENAVERFTKRYFAASSSSSVFDRRDPEHPLLIFPITDRQVPTDSIPIYSQILREPPYRVAGARVVVDTSFSPSDIASIKGELASLSDITGRIQLLEQSEARSERELQEMRQGMAGYRMDSLDFIDFSRQVMLAFPRVTAVRLGRVQSAGPMGPDDDPQPSPPLPTVAIREGTPRLGRVDVSRLDEFVRRQLRLDTLLLIREYN